MFVLLACLCVSLLFLFVSGACCSSFVVLFFVSYVCGVYVRAYDVVCVVLHV